MALSLTQGLWEDRTQTKFTPSIQYQKIYEKRDSFVGAEHQWFFEFCFS
jgi:hypothetical protein